MVNSRPDSIFCQQEKKMMKEEGPFLWEVEGPRGDGKF